tara:strand:+ start:425 stop:601 length:177 start_codon:yes stop_codon:yes gene_type:complete
MRQMTNTKTYNLRLPIREYQVLAKISHDQTKNQGKFISVAELIRDAYRAQYYEELDEA